MISGTRGRRLLVVGLIGAGWLSILGNSPGPQYRRNVVGRTGDLTIAPDPGNWQNDACSLDAQVFTPVHRFGIYNGADLIREFTCVSGGNCLLRLPSSYDPCGAVAGAPDAGAGLPRPILSSADAGGADASPASGDTTLLDCLGPGGSLVQIRMTMNPRSNQQDFCNSESAVYRLEVETGTGSKSTLEFKIQIDEPDGYFGCG